MKKVIWSLVLVVVVWAVWYGLSARRSDSDKEVVEREVVERVVEEMSGDNEMSEVATSATTAAEDNDGAVADVDFVVDGSNFKFTPAALTAKKAIS